MVHSCMKWVELKHLPEGLNVTTIVLIPKKKKPNRMVDLRPISLCNVVYKVSKVLANRLKCVLPEVISETQSGFVAGRYITDNIVVAYEISHYLKRQRSAKFGNVAFKLDISKAYDKLEWCFLEGMLMKLGFCREWVDLMLLCVKSVRFNVLVNDQSIGPIVPQRGLRQGDPLSPYLFILCAEGLSPLISCSEAVGSLHGCKVSRGAPIVSHLFFVDDAYLFFRATMEKCRRVKEILQCYQKAYGQAINFNKSAASFSTCVGAEIRALLCGELGVKEVVDDSSYLGMPTSVGRKKKALFAYVKDRVWAKIQNWKNKALSKAGKEILLKTVLQEMPNYVMSLFKLPSDTCDELKKIFNEYWWGNQEGKGGIRWCKWDILCNQKKDGGMSFLKLSDFNLALLAKQGWRILTNPTCLMVRILKARYFKNSEFFSSDLGDNPSYIWRSIWAAKGTLVSGCRWRVGDGKSIKIWGDPWLQDTVSTRISSPQVFGGENMLVEELISECGTSWNVEKLNELLDVPDVMKVLDIPLSVRKHVDCWM